MRPSSGAVEPGFSDYSGSELPALASVGSVSPSAAGALFGRSRSVTSFVSTEHSLHSEDEAPEPAVRHGKYFLSDGNVVFLVGGTLFNVHRYIFQRDSPFFRETLSYRVGPGLEGFPLTEPIVLEDLRIVDFERFLGVIYPDYFGIHNATTVEEWSSVLEVADRWEFHSIRALAIKELAVLSSPVDKIVLGKRYDIPQWLPAAYCALCQRSAALSIDEGHRLGIEDVINIAETRQIIRQPYVGKVSTARLVSVIADKFGFTDLKADQEMRWIAHLRLSPHSLFSSGSS